MTPQLSLGVASIFGSNGGFGRPLVTDGPQLKPAFPIIHQVSEWYSRSHLGLYRPFLVCICILEKTGHAEDGLLKRHTRQDQRW